MRFRSLCLLVVPLCAVTANAQVNLGTAAAFGLLGGAGVTNADAGTRIIGDVGSSPTPAVTGITQSMVQGNLYLTANAVTAQAQADLTTAYGQAVAATCNTNETATPDLSGKTLLPGVYCFSTGVTATFTGTLTLDGQGNPDALFIFQVGRDLVTGTDSTVSLINGASACNVFWQVATSATIQTNNAFVGTIMALASIVLNGGTLDGRALASVGSVSINSAAESVRDRCRPVSSICFFSGANTSGAPDSTVRFINDGNRSDSSPAGDLCASIFVFDGAEELTECCSCKITPNGLLTLSVNGLTSNTLTGSPPTKGVIKFLSTGPNSNGACDPTITSSREGIRGAITHILGRSASAESECVTSSPSVAEVTDLGEDCKVLKELGSGHGVCSCTDAGR